MTQFPTLVWARPSGEALCITILPETPEEALADLATFREVLARPPEPQDAEPR